MKKTKSSDSLRPFSSIVFDGHERAAARSMLYPVGFKPEDFKKPLIGIASTWGNVTPCNMHIDKLALESEKGANAAGGKAIVFNTITISDGISMGSEGMKYSLVSREVIADSIETVVGCAGMDGFVAIGGCDKNMPGSLIAMARLNRPSVFVYGGTILPGCITGDTRKLDIVSVFEAIGAHANQKISDAEFQAVEQCAIPGPGSCGGMYTANTMASAIEALGMSLPNSSAQNAISPAKMDDCRRAGACVIEMLKSGIRPLDILTKKAFENAITVVIALGGSTNAVLHLLAIAHAAKVKLTTRRLHARRQTRARARGFETERKTSDVRTRRHRRHPAVDENAARQRTAPRRRPDRDRRDHGANARRRETVSGRPDHHPAVRQADQKGQPSRHSARQSRVRRRGGENSPARKACNSPARRIVFESEEKALKASSTARS